MAHGKPFDLFLINGTADCLIIAELSNLNGKVIKIPCMEITDCKHDDIRGAEVYFLLCFMKQHIDTLILS